MEIEVNYLAVLVAAVVSMFIGGLWYSSLLFANAWMKEMGFTEKDIEKAKAKGMGKTYFLNFLVMLLFSYTLARFVHGMNMRYGLEMAFWIWLGFIVTLQYGRSIWGDDSMKLVAIHSSYWLVTIMAMGAILIAWI